MGGMKRTLWQTALVPPGADGGGLVADKPGTGGCTERGFLAQYRSPY